MILIIGISELHFRVVNKSHMYDATEIFRTLPQHQKEAYFKTGFYLLSFFFYLYKYVTCFSLTPFFDSTVLLLARMIVNFIAEGE